MLRPTDPPFKGWKTHRAEDETLDSQPVDADTFDVEKKGSQNGVCRCCLAEGTFQQMDHRVNNDVPTESCADMLLTTFSITFEQPRDVSVDGANLICNVCETRLREAHTFWQQVIDAQSNFMLRKRKKILTVRLERLDIRPFVKTKPGYEDSLETHVSDIEMDADETFCMNTIPQAKPKNVHTEKPVSVNGIASKLTTVENKSKRRRDRLRKVESVIDKKSVQVKNNNRSGNTDSPGIKCGFCEVTIRPLYQDASKHLQTKHGVEVLQKSDVFGLECDICSETFPTCKKKVMHIRHKHFKCTRCPKVCCNVYEREEHTRTHRFRCRKCDESFFTINERFNHERRVHRYKCKSCMALFKSESSRNKHMVRAHGAPRYVCGACGKTFDLKLDLSGHQRRDHLMERNFKCTVCDYVCFYANSLKSHMHKHSDVKKFECALCSKKFSHEKTLRNHLNMHNGVKRQVCKVCGAAFVQRASLKYHLEKYHPNHL